MSKKQPVGKTIAWAYGAVITFVAAYLIGGIMLEKSQQKKEEVPFSKKP